MHSLFFPFSFVTVLLLILNSYTSQIIWFISVKLSLSLSLSLCVWADGGGGGGGGGGPRGSIFDSVSFLLNFVFFSTKSMDFLTLKHNSFKNKSNRKATHSFALRPLIFKMQQGVLKFNDICVSWGSPKTELEKNLLNF